MSWRRERKIRNLFNGRAENVSIQTSMQSRQHWRFFHSRSRLAGDIIFLFHRRDIVGNNQQFSTVADFRIE